MRYLELLVTDVTEGHDSQIRTEWVHRDHIESIEPYLYGETGGLLMLWLELTLTSGRTRYIPLRPARAEDVDDVARTAIRTLLEHGGHPVHAIALDTGCGDEADRAQRRPC